MAGSGDVPPSAKPVVRSASCGRTCGTSQVGDDRGGGTACRAGETCRWPRVVIVEAWLENAVKLLQTEPLRSRAVLQQVIVDAVAKPIKQGRYELRFRVLPVGALVEIGVPTPSSSEMGSRGAKGGT